MPLSESEAKLLIALLRKGDSPIMDLPRQADLGSSAVYNAVRWLSEKHLIREEREQVPPRRRMIILTDKGRKVASLLQRIERELGSNA